MQIFAVIIAAEGQKRIPLEVDASDTIAIVKQKIEAKEGIPASQQMLTFCGRPLDDASRSIDDYNITAPATLYLLIQQHTRPPHIPDADRKAIQIVVSKTSNGETFTLDVNDTDTISTVKLKIEVLFSRA